MNILQAVLLDWAGTTVDYGSRAPAAVFQEIFRRCGVSITAAEAREPMGRAKREHIAAILQMPRIAGLWREVQGRAATEGDVDRLYAEFLPLQRAVLADHADVIPGVVTAMDECRRRGLRIGSTTGYTRELMEIVAPAAREQGYAPDDLVTADDVPQGRPAPWMNLRAAEHLGAYPLSSIVVVDDTPVGIQAGRNAGMWTVAVTRTGNALGLSEAEIQALPEIDLLSRLASIEAAMLAGGAHFAIESVADLPVVLDEIERRLAAGGAPAAASPA